MTRAAYHRAYWHRNLERRRESSRLSKREQRVRAACRELGIEYVSPGLSRAAGTSLPPTNPTATGGVPGGA